MGAPPAADNRPEPATSRDRAAVADYLATMAANLARLARTNQLTTLSYILDMAALEAETLAGEGGMTRRTTRPGEPE